MRMTFSVHTDISGHQRASGRSPLNKFGKDLGGRPLEGEPRFGALSSDPHLLFSHSHAGPTDVILTNELAASALESGPDRPHCTSLKRLPAFKSGNGVSGYLRGAGQITHAPTQCSSGHSALDRAQFVILLRLLSLIVGHESIITLF